MKIQLNRLNQDVHFEAVNESGNRIQFDGAPSIGGTDQGMRPM
jgi:putative redox protein